MSTLELTVFAFKRGWRFSRTFLFAGAFAAAVVAGAFSGITSDTENRVVPIALFALWTLAFGFKARQRLSINETHGTVSSRMDLELGLLLVVATHAIVQAAGDLGSALYPMLFVLVTFLVVYTPQWVGFALVGATIALEFGIYLWSYGSRANLFEVTTHSIFIIFFALVNLIFTRTEVARTRKQARTQLERDKAAINNDAQDFRLTAPARGQTGSLSREEETAKISRAAVSEIRNSMFLHVDLLKRTLKLHTSLLLWLDAKGKHLRVLECASDSDEISTRLIEQGEGAIGAILQGRKPLRLQELRPGYPGLPYYDRPTQVSDFLGVPIIERGNIRGVICADRTNNRLFEPADVGTLTAAADSLLRIIANERIFTQLQKAKSEQGKLLAASESLSEALNEKDVLNAALDAAGQIALYDFAAATLYDDVTKKQVILKARGQAAEELEGKSFTGGSTLVGAALKNRHFLPYRGEFDPKQQILFGKRSQKHFSKMNSAIVLPLTSGDTSLGTLTLAAEKPSAFGEQVRTTLQVMTNQLSTALLNAKMVNKLEEMATTDGLTGLPNHRVFQDELEKKMASAIRFGTELSVILCDVDKFKAVNDTYGHPVGDIVLKGLGETLRRLVVRDTDLPARYGGEEFIILCEGTSTEGAVNLAERVRQDLEGQVFLSDQGEFSCTISMGVATFPAHAQTKEELVEHSDAALYEAKKGGRNQVRTWEKGMTACK